MLTLNPNYAKAADAISTAIKESGKYTGIITRAEALQSKNNNPGIGLSFKSDAGETADYLDLYIGETDGKPWAGTNTVNAIMCCMKLKQAPKGQVKFERWNKETKQRDIVTAEGYPAIQGTRIGLLLQKELSEYQGQTKEKLNIFGVFNADSELTASEILAGATKAEKLAKIVQALMSKPVKDTRNARHNTEHAQPENTGGFADNFLDDVSF
jgi:hypothetical protein